MLRRKEMKREDEGAEEVVAVEEVHSEEEAEVEEVTQLLSRYVFGHISLVLFFETLLFDSEKIWIWIVRNYYLLLLVNKIRNSAAWTDLLREL